MKRGAEKGVWSKEIWEQELNWEENKEEFKLHGKDRTKGVIEQVIELAPYIRSIKIIVTKKRKPYHYLSDFTDLALEPSKTDILVVKIGYLVPELYDIRGDWIMALTPGGVDQD